MAGAWGSGRKQQRGMWLRRVVPCVASPRVALFIVLLSVVVLAEPILRAEKQSPHETASIELNPRAVCSQLVLLGNKKKNTLTTLRRSKDRINHDKKLSDSDKGDRLQVLDLFKRELTASERALLTVVKDYERTLKIDFQSLDDIGSSCEKRLEDMRGVSLQVEKDYHTFHTLHREIKMHHDNTSLPGSIMEEILRTLTHAADELEVELKENVFDAAVARGNVEVETVVKLPGGVKGHVHVAGGDDGGGGVEALVLVDPESNQYTLSRPQDTTVSHQDHHLLYDILLLFLLCSVLGMAVSWLRAPCLFGYILAGVLLGPSGFNVIKVSPWHVSQAHTTRGSHNPLGSCCSDIIFKLPFLPHFTFSLTMCTACCHILPYLVSHHVTSCHVILQCLCDSCPLSHLDTHRHMHVLY